jgi:hypothetical protein
MGYFLKNRQLQSGSTGVVLPNGSTADQPQNPETGLMRYNTNNNLMEFWNGTAWKSITTSGAIVYTIDNFTGTGNQSSFSPLTSSIGQANQVQVFVNGLFQIPVTNYNISGNAIVFTSAPPLDAPINVISTAD